MHEEAARLRGWTSTSIVAFFDKLTDFYVGSDNFGPDVLIELVRRSCTLSDLLIVCYCACDLVFRLGSKIRRKP